MKEDFERIVKENLAILHKLCRVYTNDKSEYDELFQEMMIRIWQSLESFRDESQLSTWLYRVCINTALNFRIRLEKEKRFVILAEDIPFQISFDYEKDEQLKQLYNAIRELKPIDRAIVSLYLDEKSYEEIAEVLGISKTNVATKLMRLKLKLTERLSK